jgi:hypothetical protein
MIRPAGLSSPKTTGRSPRKFRARLFEDFSQKPFRKSIIEQAF